MKKKRRIPNKETRSALRQDVSRAKGYTNVGKMFDDILGKDWRKKSVSVNRRSRDIVDMASAAKPRTRKTLDPVKARKWMETHYERN